MASNALKVALESVNWNSLTAEFLAVPAIPEGFDAGALRLAIWSKQFEQSDAGNPALPFIREMQVASQNVIILASLALYRAAAGSLRSMAEGALYYSYFRTHAVELSTLMRSGTYFMDKSEIIEFYRTHVPDFGVKQERLNLIADMNAWYKSVSAIIHGQKPGEWVAATAISEIALDSEILARLAAEFTQGIRIVDGLFKICVAPDLWDAFSKGAKEALLEGIPGNTKVVLGLDAA